MSAVTLQKYSSFDAIEYIKKLRNAGATQDLAEVQAQEMEHVITSILQQTKQESKEIFNNKELATKGDLDRVKLELQKEIEIVRKEIAENSTKLVLWMFGMFGTFGVFFLGILAKGFHWL